MNFCFPFYRDLFLSTGGYIPLWPFKSAAQIGDLFLIRSGRMVRIGNICLPFFGLAREIEIGEKFYPAEYSWDLESGISTTIKSRESLCEIDGFIFPNEKQGMLIRFAERGAYFFRSRGVSGQSIINFNQIEFKLLQQLASEKFNFTEIYVVTSAVEVDNFAMAIGKCDTSSLMLSASDQAALSYTLSALVQENLCWKVEYMHRVRHLHLAQKGGAMFFKARKLTPSPRGKELIHRYMEENFPKEILQYRQDILHYCPTQILPSEMIYPASAHEYFHFRKLSLNDIAVFFGD